MPSQKEIRARISSTISTQQITKAMKLVSATKLRKASEAITRMRPYAQKLQGIMGNLQESTEDPRLAAFFETREPKKIAVFVVTSDRGLCGAFNANVVKKVRALIQGEYAEAYKNGTVTFFCIGKKGAETLKRYGIEVNTDYSNLSLDINADKVFAAINNVLNQYLAGEFDSVSVVYNKFKNAATQILVNEPLLPIVADTTSVNSVSTEYLFEPGKVEILLDLIPRSIKTQFYRMLLDSLASEHGARMVAMDKATDNAGELLRSLRLAYNQARQAAITREISEIVGGVAALEG
ncbi:MAG: synthase subcomplex gamma subunit [Bacteroidota bacterium]|jgi:F-type H+-transporting ATPase subunit gamma